MAVWDALPLAGLVVVGLVGLALLDVVIRRSLVGVGLALVATAAGFTFPALSRLSLGGTNVGVWDVSAALLLAAAIARFLRARRLSGLQWLLVAFGVVVTLSVAQGVVEYGLNTAVNEFRKYFWFIAVGLYFSTVQFDRRLLDRIGRAWMVLAGFLGVLVVLRWSLQPLGVGDVLFGAFRGHEPVRVVHAIPTLILLQGALIGALSWVKGEAPTWMIRLTPVLFGLVVLLQHRTVWAAGLVTVALFLVMERELARKIVPLVTLVVITVAALGLTLSDDEAVDLPTQLADAAAFRGTWEWRIEGWRTLIAQGPEGLTEVMIGQPFGGGWERVMYGNVVSVSPHNFYVETYLRTGLIGLGLLVGLYLLLLWGLTKRRDHGGLLGTRALLLLLVAHPVLYIPYTPAPEQGLILGLAISAVGSGMVSRTPVTDDDALPAEVG